MISETVRPQPDRRVLEWLRRVTDDDLHLSVLSLGEIRKGIALLPDGTRREKLQKWLEQDIRGWFADRLLPISAEVADRWGRMAAEAGRPLPAVDSLIAATALHHGLRVVTRNAEDFRFPGVEVIDPWDTATDPPPPSTMPA